MNCKTEGEIWQITQTEFLFQRRQRKIQILESIGYYIFPSTNKSLLHLTKDLQYSKILALFKKKNVDFTYVGNKNGAEAENSQVLVSTPHVWSYNPCSNICKRSFHTICMKRKKEKEAAFEELNYLWNLFSSLQRQKGCQSGQSYGWSSIQTKRSSGPKNKVEEKRITKKPSNLFHVLITQCLHWKRWE